jgi:hypothetical protein
MGLADKTRLAQVAGCNSDIVAGNTFRNFRFQLARQRLAAPRSLSRSKSLAIQESFRQLVLLVESQEVHLIELLIQQLPALRPDCQHLFSRQPFPVPKQGCFPQRLYVPRQLQRN